MEELCETFYCYEGKQRIFINNLFFHRSLCLLPKYWTKKKSKFQKKCLIVSMKPRFALYLASFPNQVINALFLAAFKKCEISQLYSKIILRVFSFPSPIPIFFSLFYTSTIKNMSNYFKQQKNSKQSGHISNQWMAKRIVLWGSD